MKIKSAKGDSSGTFLIRDLKLNKDVKIFLFILFYSNRLFVHTKLDLSVMHQIYMKELPTLTDLWIF